MDQWSVFDGSCLEHALVRWHRLPAPIRARALEVRVCSPMTSAPQVYNGRGACLVLVACHVDAIAQGDHQCLWTVRTDMDTTHVHLAIEHTVPMADQAKRWIDRLQLHWPSALPCPAPANPAVLEKRTRVRGLLVPRSQWTATSGHCPVAPTPLDGELCEAAYADLQGPGLVVLSLGGGEAAEAAMPSAVAELARVHGLALRVRGRTLVAGHAEPEGLQAFVQALHAVGIHARFPHAGGALRDRCSAPVLRTPYGPLGATVAQIRVQVQDAGSEVRWLFQVRTQATEATEMLAALGAIGLSPPSQQPARSCVPKLALIRLGSVLLPRWVHLPHPRPSGHRQ